MKKHPLILVIFVALLATGAAVGLSFAFERPAPAPRHPDEPARRIVSLMPPVTETLFEIGAGDRVVGRTEWCKYPPEAERLPLCGSALTPDSETIVRLKPDLILANSGQGTARDKLNALGNAQFLPWLTAEDVVASTRKLGELTGKTTEADSIADELQSTLFVPAPEHGPRVLVVIAQATHSLDSVTFIRRDSLHGRMLNAAGGVNVVNEEISGTPVISMERVIELDPDIILVLDIRDEVGADVRAAILDDWSRLTPLTAVKNGRVGVLNGSHFYGAGRRLIRAVEDLRRAINELKPDGE